MKYLLDTDTCIDLLRGRREVVANAGAVSPDDCAVSAVTTYELFTGVQKCKYPAEEHEKVVALLAAVHELPFDRAASERTASIRAVLEVQGEMIGPYDVMLAGQALAAGLLLVTSNTAEFARIDKLTTVDWRG